MANLPRQQQFEVRQLLQRDHNLLGAVLFGLDGFIVEIQARAIEVLGKPGPIANVTRISGMARESVRESMDRIRGAFAKLQIPDSPVEILINLAPPDLPKEGTWLDLPIAIIMLQAAGVLPDLSEEWEKRFVIFGELGLHADVRRVPGALSLAMAAKPGQALIVPADNEKECALVKASGNHEGCQVLPVATLGDVLEFSKGQKRLESHLKTGINFESAIAKAPDFSAVRGQSAAKEAAVIAAAGGHNLLMIGPPGEGKTLLASAMSGILPRLSTEEKVQLTKIYSAYGALEHDGEAVTRRPFRSVHHTASKQALVGGGSGIPRPGEITLAHLGILFLDEIAEFSRATLETLRQPLESGEVVISRVRASLTYPCRVTLVAAMNPCPCGYYGSDLCTCKDRDVAAYHKKLSGPLLDRLDLQVELSRLSTDDRFGAVEGDQSHRLRKQVEAARAVQTKRFEGTGIAHNAAIPGGSVRDYCAFSSTGFETYKDLVSRHVLSTRSIDRLAKVSRTVADLAVAKEVEPDHVVKAATYVVGGLLRASF
jgi:magnesium chelatase family protein